MMRQAMLEAKRLGKVVAAHCEDNRLLRGGTFTMESMPASMGTGEFALRANGGLWPGICAW